MLCDLHIHSTFSDGTDDPTRLVQLAEELGLVAVALCDHNTVEGLPEFLRAAEGSSVEAVPAVEFTTDYKGTELHLLAMYVRPEYYDQIRRLLEKLRQAKEQGNRDLADRLNRAGYQVDYEAIRATYAGYVSRAHFAQVLTEKGYTASIEDAFRTLLHPGAGFYIPPLRLPALEVLEFINAIGAVSVLAHPLLSADRETVEQFLEEAVPLGLDAIETIYTTYDEETAALAARLARKYALLDSGGSDYHGTRKTEVYMGKGSGNLEVPETVWRSLKERAREKGGQGQ